MTKYSITLTRDPRSAMQFMSKSEAAAMAKAIRWRASDAIEINVMGFRLWAIADDHMNYVRSVQKEQER